MSTPDDVPDDAKQKTSSVLPLAPGGVYAVKWETRVQRARPLKITPVEYAPPYPVNEANRECFLIAAPGGYYLGEVVFEIKEDRAPITANNFVQLCDYHCYAGTMFQVYPSNWIVGGDFTKLSAGGVQQRTGISLISRRCFPTPCRRPEHLRDIL